MPRGYRGVKVRVQSNQVSFVVMPDAGASLAGGRGQAPDSDSVYGSVGRSVFATERFRVRAGHHGSQARRTHQGAPRWAWILTGDESSDEPRGSVRSGEGRPGAVASNP